MKRTYILMGLAMLLATACSDHTDETLQQSGQSGTTLRITAQLQNPTTRVSFSAGDSTTTHMLWNAGDKVELSTADGNYCGTYTLTPSADGTTAELVADGEALENVEGTIVYAVYGSPSWNGEGGSTVSFPTLSDTDNSDTTPFLYATGTISENTLSFTFRHFYSYLKLTLTDDIFSDSFTTTGATDFELRGYTENGMSAPIAVADGSFDFSTYSSSLTTTDLTFSIDSVDLGNSSWTGYIPILATSNMNASLSYVELVGAEGVFLKRDVPSGGFLSGNLYTLDTSSDAIRPLLEVNAVPVVSTEAVSEIGESSATFTGTVDYASNVTLGFEYALDALSLPDGELGSASTTITPLTAQWDSDLATYRFATTITDLLPNTTYYVRSFARKETGNRYYGFGEVISFTTAASEIQYQLQVSNTEVTDITTGTASLFATITNNGGETITEKGFYYSTTSTAPSSSDVKLVSTALGDSISATMTGLSTNTRYYVRAFVTNGEGTTTFGAVNAFVTSVGNTIPTVGAITTSNILGDGFSLSAILLDNGGSEITEKGFCYSTTNATPTVSDSTVVATDADDMITVTLTGLTARTTYYVRAYANNGVSIGYSSVIQVTTAGNAPEEGDNVSPTN